MINKVLVSLSSGAAQVPLHEEIWSYFYDTYLNSEATYENLNIGGLISIPAIIIGLFVGFSLAAIGAVFNKRIHGRFVKTLLREECLSPESARSLPELNYADKLTVRYAVKRSVNLRRVVRCREEEEHKRSLTQTDEASGKKDAQPFKIDPDKHHFYIPEDMKYMADTKFETKGNSWLGAIVCTVLLLVGLVVALMLLPKLLSILNDFVGTLNS